MNTGELFSSFIRRLIAAFALIVLCAAAGRAQSAGTIGVYTRESSVFSAQASSATSAFFPDFGFGCNFLNYQTTGFSGTIDVEWSPNGSAPFYVLGRGNWSSDTHYHTLQIGGYFPNMHSVVTRSAGSVSAWYTAQAGPCPLFGSGVGSNGPSSPLLCDTSTSNFITNGTTTNIVQPLNAGDTTGICGMTISFQAAPSNGTLQLGQAPSSSCSAPNTTWEIYTSAGTPLVISVPFAERSSGQPLQQYWCFTNNSGVEITVSYTYASVLGL